MSVRVYSGYPPFRGDRTNSESVDHRRGVFAGTGARSETIEASCVRSAPWSADNPPERAGWRPDLRPRTGRFSDDSVNLLDRCVRGTPAKKGRIGDRLDEAANLDWQLLGAGCDACPVNRTASTTAHERGDDTMELFGPEHPSRRRYRLPASAMNGRCAATSPLSRFIAQATGSLFSHTGIIAVEDGSPVVYDCSSDGVHAPAVRGLDARLHRIHGRQAAQGRAPASDPRRNQLLPLEILEQQVPFDYEFRPDHAALYCVELTEKAFRSQGLVLSEPVRIGDWEHLGKLPPDRACDPVRHRADARAPDHA